MTPRGEFYSTHRVAIQRAATVIKCELAARGVRIQLSTAVLVAMHACAAFSEIPETPEHIALENIQRAMQEHAMQEHDGDCASLAGGRCDCGADGFQFVDFPASDDAEAETV